MQNSSSKQALVASTNLSTRDLNSLNALATLPPRKNASPDELYARRVWRDELDSLALRLDDHALARVQTGETRVNSTKGSSKFSTSRQPLLSLSPNNPSTSVTAVSSVSHLPCVACGESGIPTVAIPCKHRFCKPCLSRLFLLATRDESLHPASCCGMAIDENTLYESNLTHKQRSLYRSASQEFKLSSRVYCSNKRCSIFLGPGSTERKILTCSSCNSKTCAACCSPEHSVNQACTADLDDDAATKLVNQLRGVRCPKCKRVVLEAHWLLPCNLLLREDLGQLRRGSGGLRWKR
ncbi:hypothetical protein JCM8547_002156 [Rhodosporidiobolus lusitaniae]